ncbi:MAG: hypothetical protein IPJ30_04620 [Acidobacteria bacterium]|nr:hypothetical protein [Acidobacteriota bacterium]
MGFSGRLFPSRNGKARFVGIVGRVAGVPQVLDSFEINDNLYLVLEHVQGTNLEKSLLSRRRRLSVRSILLIAKEVCELLRSLHSAGWIWGDCKPANLLRSRSGKLRPLDFEGAYRVGEPDPYRWRTRGFSDGPVPVGGIGNDMFSLGATLYFLITGRTYDAQNRVAIERRRQNVPKSLVALTMDLLESRCVTADEAARRLDLIEL